MLKCPIIIDGNNEYYGGSQEWFKDDWARKAGCASVCATNVYEYYYGHETNYSKEEYIKSMEHIYEYVKPGKGGYPYVYLYAKSLGKLLGKDYHIIRRPNYHDGYRFVKESIDKGHPVSMLILTHHSLRLKDDKWHWMTIFDYDRKYIYYSSYGKLKKFSMKTLFKKYPINIVKMVTFYK